jgi:hypothetical protein
MGLLGGVGAMAWNGGDCGAIVALRSPLVQVVVVCFAADRD